MTQHNELLAALHPDTLAALRPTMRILEFRKGDILLDSGEPPASVIFPTSGLVSLLGTTTEGHSLEVASVSRRGFAGLPGIAPENWHSVVRAVVPGSAVTVPAHAFGSDALARRDLQSALLYWSGTLLGEASQSVLCHRYHPLLDRLCRWLLRASSFLGTDRLDLTQEDLSLLLGVPRTSLTNAALAVQDAGAIWYRYGRIRILDPNRLARSACSCLTLITPIRMSASAVVSGRSQLGSPSLAPRSIDRPRRLR